MGSERRPAGRDRPAGAAGRLAGERDRVRADLSAESDFPSREELLALNPPLVGERIWKDHAELFEAENRALVKFATAMMYGYNVPSHLAEDVVQEAWADLVAQWDGVDRPLPWMYAVVRKKTHRLIQRRERQTETEEAAAYIGRAAPRPATSMETVIALHDTLKEVAALPEQQRAAVVLRFFEDRPYAEIADLMQIDPATVGVHIHRGRSQLRSKLNGFGMFVLFLATLAGVPTTRPANPASGIGNQPPGPHGVQEALTATEPADNDAADALAVLRAKVEQLQQQITQEGSVVHNARTLDDSPQAYLDAAVAAMSAEQREAALEALRSVVEAYAPAHGEKELAASAA